MQIAILNGIYTDESPDFRTSYPKNLIPVPKVNGISNGYLRPADGLIHFADVPGLDRGGINWNGKLYRVVGSLLIYIDSIGTVTVLGDVGDDRKQVTLTYSFDRLAIASNENLFYYDGTTLTQVTDADLGIVTDLVWVDGYFMTTDGEYLVVTELNDPTSIDPLKYGSSEASPDPIVALKKIKNEVYALNRYTIEVFDNVGGSTFPFSRIEGAQIDRGVLGTHACTNYLETLAFLGSGRNEAPAIWVGNNSVATKLSTREIEQILAEYTEDELSSVILESRVEKQHQFLYVHLEDKTLVYDGIASQALEHQVWHILSSSLDGTSKYRARNFVWIYNKFIFGDPDEFKLGYLSDSTSKHFDDDIEWEFGTSIVYNESNGAIFHELELVALTGRIALGSNPMIWTDYSTDGITWSNKKPISAGKQGQRNKRLVWLQQGHMTNWRMQRFRGTSETHISIARLEAQLEPLFV